MAQNEIIYKVKADVGNSDKEVGKVEMSMDELNKASKELTSTQELLSQKFEDVYGEMQPLSGRMGELEDRMYELALAGKQNTEEFQLLQAEVVKYKQVIIDTDKQVDRLTEQGKGLGTALQIGQSVAAGYGALEGSMALLGGESEQLQETFVKLQAVQTVLTSLEELKLSLDKQSIIVTKAKQVSTAVMTFAQNGYTMATTATTVATKALGAAMLALPIVALIALIVAAVYALNEFFSVTEDAADINDRLNESIERQNEAFQKLTSTRQRDIDNRLKLAKSEKASIEEIQELELQRLREQERTRRGEIELIKQTNAAKRNLLNLAYKQGDDDLAEQIKGEIQANRDKYKELKSLDGQYQVDRTVLINEFNNKQKEQEEADAKERADKYKAALEKRKQEEEKANQLRLDRMRLMEDLVVQSIEDEGLRSLTQLRINHQREREELIKKYGEDQMLIAQLEAKQAIELSKLDKEQADKLKAEQDAKDKEELEKKKAAAELDRKDRKAALEAELIQYKENFEMRLSIQEDLAEIEREAALAQENLTAGEKLLIQEQYDEKIRALNEERAEHEKFLNQDVVKATQQVTKMGYDAVQGLSDAFFAYKLESVEKGSAKELAIQKKQFEVNKKLQIAQAVMQGVQAVQAAFASGSAIPLIGAVTGPLFAAAAAATAGLNIAKIRATKFEGGSSDVGSGGGGVTPPSIPSASDVAGGESGNSTLTAGLDGSGQNGNIKVSVVDSDIKASMEASKKVDVISSIG